MKKRIQNYQCPSSHKKCAPKGDAMLTRPLVQLGDLGYDRLRVSVPLAAYDSCGMAEAFPIGWTKNGFDTAPEPISKSRRRSALLSR